jgi:transcription antitermination factor NusG
MSMVVLAINSTPGSDSEEVVNATDGALPDSAPLVAEGVNQRKWYAIQTRSRHEKIVDKHLRRQGIITFLPLAKEIHRWSDRKKEVESPLFGGYAFVRVAASPEERLKVLRTHGVVKFVGVGGVGIPIPEEQIEAVKAVTSANIPFRSYPFLKLGQRVRIREGALEGVQGILISQKGMRNLVISVDAIQRSLSIQIEGYKVEPV